jgi:hypothetical protein
MGLKRGPKNRNGINPTDEPMIQQVEKWYGQQVEKWYSNLQGPRLSSAAFLQADTGLD